MEKTFPFLYFGQMDRFSYSPRARNRACRQERSQSSLVCILTPISSKGYVRLSLPRRAPTASPTGRRNGPESSRTPRIGHGAPLPMSGCNATRSRPPPASRTTPGRPVRAATPAARLPARPPDAGNQASPPASAYRQVPDWSCIVPVPLPFLLQKPGFRGFAPPPPKKRNQTATCPTVRLAA